MVNSTYFLPQQGSLVLVSYSVLLYHQAGNQCMCPIKIAMSVSNDITNITKKSYISFFKSSENINEKEELQ